MGLNLIAEERNFIAKPSSGGIRMDFNYELNTLHVYANALSVYNASKHHRAHRESKDHNAQ